MKNAIKDRIMLSEKEKEDLWDNATFVFDTNVLLELYRVTRKASDAMLNAIERVSDRVWLPLHVVKEFGKNRYKIIYDNAGKYNANESKIIKAKKDFINICDSEVKDKESVTRLSTEIDVWLENQNKLDNRIKDPSNDEILEKLLSLFDKKVGKGFSKRELEDIEKNGEERYRTKTPPGYCDGKQKQANEYGDLIIWKEIIRYSKENNKDIIFVTQDTKEDWWFKENGRTIGPRYELREEFSNETSHTIYFYTLDGFLEISNLHYKTGIEQSVIDELRESISDEEQTELLKSIYLNAFKQRYMRDIRNRIAHNIEVSADDVARILSYINIMEDEGKGSEEIAASHGYLQGAMDVYSVISGVENEDNVKILENSMINSDKSREALMKLLNYEWSKKN